MDDLPQIVGPIPQGDGRGAGQQRTDRTNAAVSTQGHGKYAEQTSRGTVYCLATANTGATVAAGHVAPPAAAAATTLTLSNPVGSGVDFEILYATLSHLTGTPGTGAWAYCVSPSSVISATPNATAQPQKVGSAASKALGYTATALTAGLVHTTARLFANSVFAAAIDAATQNKNVLDEVDGSIVIPPGFILTLAPPATGTSHVVAAQIVFAEVVRPS